MDPLRRLQLVWALIQLDDQQNIVTVQHVEAAATMVVLTVVAETTGVWAI